MPQDDLLNSYIKAEQAKIKVAPYEEKVVNNAFKYRTYGYWSGTAMGLGWGAIVGVGVALAFPVFLSTTLVMSTLQTVAMFSAIGALAGQASGMMIGAAAGASAGAARERERRDRALELEKDIRKNPPGAEAMQNRIAEHATEQARLARDGKTEVNTVEDIYKQSGGNILETMKRMVSPRMLLISAVLGAVVGALLGLGGQTIVPALLLGKTAATMAEISPATAAAVGALFGAIAGPSFGFTFPHIFTSLSQYTRSLFNGQAFEKSVPPQPAMQPATEYAPGPDTAKSYASAMPSRASFQELIERDAAAKNTSLSV